MNAHRAAGDPREPRPQTTDDELGARIARALQSRAAAERPDVDAAAARLRAEATATAQRPATVLTLRRTGKVVASGLVVGTLAVAGAGAAAAANPYSPVARAVETAVQSVGIDWSVMPDGYTRAQYEAVWSAYGLEEIEQLSDLWQTDLITTKARAGQMLLDGEVPPLPTDGAPLADDEIPWEDIPVEPADPEDVALDAFWDAGYTLEDADALTRLWHVDPTEAKVRAGQLLVDGQPVPVPPSEPPAAEDAPAAPPHGGEG